MEMISQNLVREKTDYIVIIPTIHSQNCLLDLLFFPCKHFQFYCVLQVHLCLVVQVRGRFLGQGKYVHKFTPILFFLFRENSVFMQTHVFEQT